MLFITYKTEEKSPSFHGFSNKFQIKRCGYEAQKVVAAFKFSHSQHALARPKCSSSTKPSKLNSDKTVNGQKQRKREPSSGFWVKMAAAAKDSSSGGATSSVKGVLTHGGKYVQYNVYGNLFEVSSKYVPPIRPIGRGAYGIVWWVFFPPFFLFILIIYPSLLSIY